jgi:GNAT superfamily N-acetyltransferase
MSKEHTEYGFWIREAQEVDREWMREVATRRWGSPVVVSRGQAHSVESLPGLLAMRHDWPLGLLTYHIAGSECEIITLDSMIGGMGLGTMLLAAIQQTARAARCQRLWLITTNDNTTALRYYQKRGFRLVAVHIDALEHSRRIKPEIPLIGNDGIPLRDEIELQMIL